jgi:hypothetical protein
MLAALAAAGYADLEIAEHFQTSLSGFSRRLVLNPEWRRAVLIGRGVLAERLNNVVFRDALNGNAKSALQILRMMGAFRKSNNLDI